MKALPSELLGTLRWNEVASKYEVTGHGRVPVSAIRDINRDFADAFEEQAQVAGMADAMASGEAPTALTVALESYVPGVLLDPWSKAQFDWKLKELAPTHNDPKRHGKWLRFGNQAGQFVNTLIAPGAEAVEIDTEILPGNTFKVGRRARKTGVTRQEMETSQSDLGLDIVAMKTDTLFSGAVLEQGLGCYYFYRNLDATGTAIAGKGNYRSTDLIHEDWGSWADDTNNIFQRLITAEKICLANGSVKLPNTIICDPLSAKYLRENAIWKSDYSLTVDQHGITLQDGQVARHYNFCLVDPLYVKPDGSSDYAFGPDAVLAYLEPYSNRTQTPVLRAVTGADAPVVELYPDPIRDRERDVIWVKSPEYAYFTPDERGINNCVLWRNVRPAT